MLRQAEEESRRAYDELERTRERAARVGGMQEVESAPGAATTVYVRIPLRDAGLAVTGATD